MRGSSNSGRYLSRLSNIRYYPSFHASPDGQFSIFCTSRLTLHRLHNRIVYDMPSIPRLVDPNQDSRPASLQAEKTILGAMLVDPLAIVDATMLLKTEDFALDSHRRIYEVMLHLSEVGYAIDLITVSEDLRRKKELDSVGGLPYLYEL